MAHGRAAGPPFRLAREPMVNPAKGARPRKMLRPRHRRGGGADWAAARARSQGTAARATRANWSATVDKALRPP